MVWREISPEDLYGLRNPLIIDVRSPCEFQEERIPEAVNIPLLSDAERAVTGTIYKLEGEFVARIKAVSVISPKIPGILDEILRLREHSRPLVVHCWRGGLRSEAVASFLSISGINCYRLTGGYKAWRAMVLSELSNNRYDFAPIVIDGLTGSGKTELLKSLASSGMQVLDLEELANHRGSVFGGLGKSEQPSQKNFDAALWYKLRAFDLSKPVFLEAESRKIGKLSLPDPVLDKILHGESILAESSLERRAERIASEYLKSGLSNSSLIEESSQMLKLLKERLGTAQIEKILALAGSGEIGEAVKILLLDYYDPLYRKSIKARKFGLVVSSDELEKSVQAIVAWVQGRTNQVNCCA